MGGKRRDYQKYKNFDLSKLTDLERGVLIVKIELGDTKRVASVFGKTNKAINAILARASAKLDGTYDVEGIRQKRNEYMAKNRDKQRQYHERNYPKNKDKYKAKMHEYYVAHKEDWKRREKARKEKEIKGL